MKHSISFQCYNAPNACAENLLRNCFSSMRSPSISFADMGGFFAVFEGVGHQNIDSWLKSFEDTATLTCLPELQKDYYPLKLNCLLRQGHRSASFNSRIYHP